MSTAKTTPTPRIVEAPVLGRDTRVPAVVEDAFCEATIKHGPRRVLRVKARGSTYRVLEEDCIPL